MADAQRLIQKEKEEKTGELDLSFCGLTKIPKEVFELTWLEKLSLRQNEIWIGTLQEFKNLNQLSELNLRFNKITNIKPLGYLTELNTLDLSRNQINDIKPLENLTELKELYLGENQISDLKPLENLTDLNILKINRNQITNIEPLKNLTELNILSLYENKISDITPLKNLTDLNTLYLYENKIRDINSLANLTELNILKLNRNQINNIKPLNNLTELNILDISRNQLENIKPLENLIALDSLKLGDNKIKDISPLLPLLKVKAGALIGYKKVFIKHNPIEKPPMSIVNKGRKAIINYFEKAKEIGQEQVKNIKVFFIGNSTAGKSTINNYLINDEIDNSIITTHGIELKNWQISQEKENINQNITIWDFGGQECYHATHRPFLHKNSIYVLVWEKKTNVNEIIPTEIKIEKDNKIITEKREIEHYDNIYWLENIRFFTENRNPVIVVENKNKGMANDHKITLENYSEVKISETFPFIPNLSDNTINYEWKKAAHRLKEDILDQINDINRNDTIVSHWNAVYHRLLSFRENKNIISVEKFKNICREEINKEEGNYTNEDLDIDNILTYLEEETGTILYYPEISSIKDKIIINPFHFTDTIYDILNKDIRNNNGNFTFEHVKNIVGDEETAQFYIDLMLKFELIFRLKHSKTHFVASQYLQDEPPFPEMLQAATRGCEFKLGIKTKNIMPSGIRERLIARYGAKAKQDLFWKSGIFYNDKINDEVIPVLINLHNRNTISIQSDANKKEGNIAAKRILRSVKQLIQPKDFLLSIDSNLKSWVPYEKLLKKRKEKRIEIESKDEKTFAISKFKPFTEPVQKPPMEVFVSYSKEDKDSLDKLKLYCETLFKDNIMEEWDDTKLIIGEEWEEKINKKLESADMIIFLVSPEMIATKFIQQVEMEKAIKRAAKDELQILPIILKPCDWQNTPLQKYNIPFKGTPINKNSGLHSEEKAWLKIGERLRSYYENEFQP